MPAKTKAMPPAEVLWDRFDYLPLTGQLVSKNKRLKRPRRQNGKCKYNMTSICIDRVQTTYAVHRLVWKWITGKEPSKTVDHINWDKRDNRAWNLREASYSLQNKHQRRYQ